MVPGNATGRVGSRGRAGEEGEAAPATTEGREEEMSLPTWVQTVIGAVMAFAFGSADAFYFHSFSKDTDLLVVMGALAALGIHGAFVTGKSSA